MISKGHLRGKSIDRDLPLATEHPTVNLIGKEDLAEH
jgi:hypothetical protein